MSTIKTIFGKNGNILIGMIHLSPLLSFEGYLGMDQLIADALADLAALEMAGFDGALIENDNDKPHTEFANVTQIACFTQIASKVCEQATIPIGVQMMLNDWRSSFAIAKVVGAKFTRLDVFIDEVSSEWGEIHPNPTQIMKYKQAIYPELLLLTDIQVKYKKMITPRPLVESAAEAIQYGSNGLVITGVATGKETPIESIQVVHEKFSNFPIFVGAGVNEQNVREQLSVANGAIVGTSIKSGARIDSKKALHLKNVANSY